MIIGHHVEVLRPCVSHLLSAHDLYAQRIYEPVVVGHQGHDAVNILGVDSVYEALGDLNGSHRGPLTLDYFRLTLSIGRVGRALQLVVGRPNRP